MYKKIRRYNSDIHIYNFDPTKYRLDIDYGVHGKLEPLSKIGKPESGERIAAKINCSFFNMDGSAEYLGILYKGGKLYSPGDYSLPTVVLNTDRELVKGYKGTTDIAFGAGAVLIADDTPQNPNGVRKSDWNVKNPFTAVGQDKDGLIYFVVADGRSSSNAGVNCPDLIQIMRDLGCVNAFVLDGGGSSEMIVEGKIVNKPSAGYERHIGTALIAYRPIRVALDDGHGMETTGKRTPIFPDGTFMHENEFNRAVVAELGEKLTRAGIEVIYTAPGDDDTPLSTRTDTANKANADLFVSVHANAYQGVWGNHGGISTYHFPGSAEGQKAAEIIHTHLLQGTELRNRGVLTANFAVLRQTVMPAVLAECAFMDNLNEAELLKSSAYRKECATELYRGILEYLGIEKPLENVPTPSDSYKDKYLEIKAKFENLLSEIQHMYDKYN